VAQAVGYLHNLPERDLPQLVVVCDFARCRSKLIRKVCKSYHSQELKIGEKKCF